MFYLFIDCFRKKYFQLAGRASRKEHISFILFNFLLSMIIDTIYLYIWQHVSILLVKLVYETAVFIPAITLAVRRMHDLNFSGWWSLLMIIISVCLVLVSKTTIFYFFAIILIVSTLLLIFLKGTPGPNRFGPPPA
jgi:uncharacterized membrane protein YhaH (DUF805 family)